MQPIVSIIIPVYNGANYVADAIESAINQTYKNIEVIVVNDGSTDNGQTRDICNAYGSQIRYFEKENGGVATAINYGIKQMRGEYFAWLSHDDMFVPTKIERQMKSIINNNDKDCVCFSNFEFVNHNTGETKLFDLKRYCDNAKIEDGLYPILFGLVHFCTVVVSKKRIEEVGLCNEKLRTTQDIEWLFRLLRKKKNIFIDEPLTLVRLHEEQGKRIIKEYTKEQSEAHITFLKSISDDEIVHLFGSKRNYYWNMALFYRRDNNRPPFEYVRELYSKTEREERELKSLEMVRKKMDSFRNKGRIIVFCTGQYGKSLVYEMLSKEIEVDYLSDNNPDKWGGEICGIRIVSPNELSKDDYLFVAKDDPKEIIEDLNNKGFKNVWSYFELEKMMEDVLPKNIPAWEVL